MESRARVARISGIAHSYGNREVLRNLCLDLSEGVVGLVGVNGAGKTTLLRILAHTLSPSSGSVELRLERSARAVPANEVQRWIALMPQEFAPPAGVKTADFLAYVAWMRALPRSQRANRVNEVLAAVGLSERANQSLATLSGGMLRRVLLAQALLGSPRLLLLDEPTSGLDPEHRIAIRGLIAAQAAHRCVVMSSHIMEDVVHIADRVIMLDDHRIVFDGTSDELRALGQGLVSQDANLSPYEVAFLSLRRSAD